MIIDAHTHIYENGSSGGINELVLQMSRLNIDKSIIIALPEVCSNGHLLDLCNQYKGKFYAMVFPDFSQDTYIEDLIKHLSHNYCVGIKIHPRIQCIEFNNPKIDKVFEVAEKFNVPIEIDIFPWGARLDSPSLNPYSIHPLAQKYPKTKIIVAHCGAPSIIETMLLVKSNKNIFLDISFFLKYFENFTLIHDFIILCDKLNYERLIYGSDYPSYSLEEYYKITNCSLKNLSKENFSKLMYKNAQMVFNI